MKKIVNLIKDIAYMTFFPFGGAQLANGRRTREFQLEQKEKDMQFQRENKAMEHAHQEKMAWENACLNLRNEFIKDALAKFPLNISPYVLLGNNGIMLQDISVDQVSERSLPPQNLPLNIFIAPLSFLGESNAYASNGNSAKSQDITKYEFSHYISTELEKIFIGSFSRNSVRPTSLYSASYKPGVVPGLHVADELYFFLKDLPTIVVEPKYNGKKLQIVISFWSICFENTALEQVCMEIDFDWELELCKKSYEQTLRMQEILSNNNFANSEKLQNLLQFHEKVIETCKAFGIDKLFLDRRERDSFSYVKREDLSFVFEKAGLSKIFQIDPLSAREAAKPLTQALGVMLCLISDVHHAISSQRRDIEYRPILPDLLPTVFPDLKKEYKLFIIEKYKDLSDSLLRLTNNKLHTSTRYFEWMMPIVRDDEAICDKMNTFLIMELRNITGSKEKDLGVLMEQYCQSADRSFDNVLFAFLRVGAYKNEYAHILEQLKPTLML